MSLMRKIERAFTVTTPVQPPNTSLAVFSAGCFWSVEADFRTHFAHVEGLVTSCIYTGDSAHPYPTYSKIGDHAESLLIWYTTGSVSYHDLVDFFFTMHDPTQKNGQGRDIGRQYRSVIWFCNDEQKLIACNARDKCNLFHKKHVNGQFCTTRILPLGAVWHAERYHQHVATPKTVHK